MEIFPNVVMKSEKFPEKICYFFQNDFFRRKKKVEKKIESSYRCRILSGIDFSHPRSDWRTPLDAREKL